MLFQVNIGMTRVVERGYHNWGTGRGVFGRGGFLTCCCVAPWLLFCCVFACQESRIVIVVGILPFFVLLEFSACFMRLTGGVCIGLRILSLVRTRFILCGVAGLQPVSPDVEHDDAPDGIALLVVLG